MHFLWLLLLGIFTYYVVQRSVASITRTPIWLLWLVMMTPAFILTAWSFTQGQDEQFPPRFLLSLFLSCLLMYWFLIQWGRLPAAKSTLSEKGGQSGAVPLKQEIKPTLRPVDKEEESNLQQCFPWSVFYLQQIEYRPQAMICRGQLRTSSGVAYKTIKENIEAQFGDRFLVIFQEGFNGKPFFALVPNPQAKVSNAKEPVPQKREALTRPGLALTLLLTTLLTTMRAGVEIAGISSDQMQETPALFLAGLPYALSLLAILGAHEFGHYFTARYYRIRTTLPYFIPFPFFLGTFGAFIQLRSPVPNRRALFDVGIAGPLAGLVMTLPILFWGLGHSEVVPMPENSSLLNFGALDPSASILLALMTKLALGSALTAGRAIELHPLAVAGCLGLVVTALNLMPVGQLDGGHIVHAMFGQRNGAFIGQIARLLVLVLAFVHREFMLWAILLFFIPTVDEPTLNDVSELNDQRDLWGLIALSLLVMIILPAPKLLTEILF